MVPAGLHSSQRCCGQSNTIIINQYVLNDLRYRNYMRVALLSSVPATGVLGARGADNASTIFSS